MLDDQAAKLTLGADTNCIAADMESAAIAAVAQQCVIPFVAIRAVCDSVVMTVPKPVRMAIGDNGEPAIGALARELLAAPSSLAPMLRLAVAFKRACRSLNKLCDSAGPGLGWQAAANAH